MSRHIKSLHDDVMSLCGVVLNSEFHFKSVDAAILHGLHEKKPVVCRRCAGVIIECVIDGVERCELNLKKENENC